MRLIPILLAAAVFAPWFSLHAAPNNFRDDSFDKRASAQSVTVNAILIAASNEEGDTDERLAAYEENLKRNLRFDKFEFLGEGSVHIAMPGDASIALPRGQSVKVETAYYGENMVWLRVIWMDGGRQVMNVVYAKCPRGKPIVVGGAASEGQNLAILVTPR